MDPETPPPAARTSKLAITALALALLPILVLLCFFAFSFFTDLASVRKALSGLNQWHLIRENIQYLLLAVACLLPPAGILLGIISLFRKDLRRGPAIAGIVTGILVQLGMCALLLYILMARS